MSREVIIVGGLSILSFLSGMLGLGVAFAAIPFLGLFMNDLVHQVQPLSLTLNGVTALFATFGFARSGYMDWKKAFLLAVATTLSAPVGALLAQHIEQKAIWVIYFVSVAYLAYRLFKPVKGEAAAEPRFALALALAVPISILSGLLGVGPGFLLMPTLILVGFDPKMAAGINAFAVTPPSFSALVPHLRTAHWEPGVTLWCIVVGILFSYAGAKVTSVYVPSQRLKQLFGVLIVIVTLYKITTLLR
jgi:uncharacterized membrane protein YfcA